MTNGKEFEVWSKSEDLPNRKKQAFGIKAMFEFIGPFGLCTFSLILFF